MRNMQNTSALIVFVIVANLLLSGLFLSAAWSIGTGAEPAVVAQHFLSPASAMCWLMVVQAMLYSGLLIPALLRLGQEQESEASTHG